MFVLISLLLTLATLFYLYRRHKLALFSKAGITGPPPNALFGNLIEYRNTPFYDLFIKWNKEYGKIFVYFEGPTPNLVIGDPDLLQEVMIKQFSNFHGRKLFPMQKNPDKDEKVNMFLARGKRWKRLRTTINPAFSESKMRKMFPIIDQSINTLIVKVEGYMVDGPECLDIQDLFQRLTMDIICKCAFGVDTDCQNNVNHSLITSLKRFHSRNIFSTLEATFSLIFPEIQSFALKVFEYFNRRPYQNEDLKKIRSTLIQVIEARKKNTERRHDLLQLLIDAEVNTTKLLDEENLCPMNDTSSTQKPDNTTDEEKIDEEDSDNAPLKTKSNKKLLTTEEVIAQTNLFLFAGYETSSTALSYFMYRMALHPDIQDQISQEIDKAYSTAKSKDIGSLEFYDTVGKLPYLTATIYETLRYYPFASPIINRMCLKSNGTYLSNGLYIPEGTNIIPNIYAIHFNENIWETISPQKFDPERFLRRNGSDIEFIGPPHPLVWLPFGAGPRNCIGQRFAMMVIKATLGRFFYHFKVSRSKKTEDPLDIKVGSTISPKNGINIRISKRNK